MTKDNKILIPVSVVIAARNEEKIIVDAIKSVQDWADEILVGIDKGTTDNTELVAKKMGAKTIEVDASRVLSDAKNALIKAARNEWIIDLDADEQVTPELRDEIAELLQNNPVLNGYNIPFLNKLLGEIIRHGGWQHDAHIRLIRKGRARYDGRLIHEHMEVEGEVGRLKNPILHNTHRSIDAILTRITSYSTREAELMRTTLPQPTKPRHLALPALKHFWWRYISEKGYKDGVVGLIESVSWSFYLFINHAKAWELLRSEREKNDQTPH